MGGLESSDLWWCDIEMNPYQSTFSPSSILPSFLPFFVLLNILLFIKFKVNQTYLESWKAEPLFTSNPKYKSRIFQWLRVHFYITSSRNWVFRTTHHQNVMTSSKFPPFSWILRRNSKNFWSSGPPTTYPWWRNIEMVPKFLKKSKILCIGYAFNS